MTLIITKTEDGNLTIAGDVTSVLDRIGMIEAAKILARVELIRGIPNTEEEPKQ